jgi:chaperonin GroEL
VAELQREKERATHSYDIEQLNQRIAKLSDGFCLMRVGAVTQVEIRERRGRIEDALNAVRCAVNGGVVPGGGISYLALSNFLSGSIGFSKDMAGYGRTDLITAGLGDQVLVEALQVPLRALAKNAGHEPSVIVDRVLKASCERGMGPCPGWETGWDARTNTVRDFRESPVIADPLEVVKAVILTAISTASTLLTADVAITGAP